jgi:hypothetical protein
MIEYEDDFFTGFREETQPTIDADEFGRVVILEKVGP